MRKLLGIIALVLCFQCLQAQSVGEGKNLLQRFANWRETSMMKGVDTSYINLPKKGWLVGANLYVSTINLRENFSHVINLDFLNCNMNTGASWKPNISLAYRGLELSYGIDFAHRYNRDLRLQLHGKRFGGEFRYLTFEGATVDIITGLESPNNHFHFDDFPIKAKRVTVNAYFVFNTKTFSYPAGIKQTFFQKKSSGSVIAGAAYYHTDFSIENVTYGTPTMQQTLGGDQRVRSNQIAIGAGYAYNFVFRDFPLLLHASVMPMIMYTFDTHLYKDNSEAIINFNAFDNRPIDPCITSRAAISYAISDDLFLGANVNYNYFWSNLSDNFALSTYNLTGHAFVAYRF